MKNIYKICIRQYSMSPAMCNQLVPHWKEKFTSLKSLKARAKEIAEEIRTKRNNRDVCIVEIYRNSVYTGEYIILR